MIDIALQWLGDQADLGIAKSDLLTEDGYRTAVIMSLFTDARVSAEELPPGETDRRGWWADAISDIQGENTGSKLWLLERAKDDDDTRARAKEYASEALSWMVEDGIAKAVNVTAGQVASGQDSIEIEIVKPDGTKLAFSFETAWAVEGSR